MKVILFLLLLLAVPVVYGQQISCLQYDEQSGEKSPEYSMKGCKSFNELQAAGGIKIETDKKFKSYACFATTFPAEASDLFVFVEIGGVLTFDDRDKDHNGTASMRTFLGGIERNKGFTLITWTQYPKENPTLWSDGTWIGHGDAQMGLPGSTPEPESAWKSMRLPRLHAGVEDDTITFRLELNNDKDAVETLVFNRRTGRARLVLTGDERPMRCVPAGQ